MARERLRHQVATIGMALALTLFFNSRGYF
jgi:hypothetical protein